jgi:acetyltransferase-like isoleucine patch superfamily enzyme
VSLLGNLRHVLWLYRYGRRDEWGKVEMYPLGAAGERIRITGMADFGSEPYLISLGSDVTITAGVCFVTHDGGVGVLRERHPGLHVYEEIEVGDRVFIGTRTIVLPGVRIGSDVVIGAGSIVTKDVPDGTVAAGNPCRPIRPIEEYERRALERATWWRGSPSSHELERHVLASVAELRGRDRAGSGR